jgi:uncharacterized protein (TIGR02265 family)
MNPMVEDLYLPSVPAGFVAPDDSAPFDPTPYILGVPNDHCIRGLFFSSILDAATAKGVAIPAGRSYIDFKHYPVREHIELLIEMAPRCYPGESLRGAVRLMGRLAYPAFAASLVGRVMFGVLGSDVARIFNIAPKGYDCSLSHTRATVITSGAHSARVRLENHYALIDTFQVGVFEGVFDLCNRPGEVYVRSESLCDGELFARWK